MTLLKTINAGDVRSAHVGKTIALAGWVHRRRDHGNLIFIDLRDREGLVQVVFNPDVAAEAHAVAASLRNEWVIQVTGKVARRPDSTENHQLPTGEVEVVSERVAVLAESRTPPFYVNDESEVDELLRMQYRYLVVAQFEIRLA